MTVLMKKGTTILCGALLLLLTIFSSVSNAHANSITEYSGKEIFQGLFFKVGPISQLVPNSLRPENQQQVSKEELEKVADRISKTISTEHPEYYDDLKTAVYQKKYEKTYDLINEGGKYIVNYLKTNYGSDYKSVENKTKAAQPNCVTWLYVEVVAVVQAAAILFPAVVTYIQYPDNASTLDKQKAVKDLIVNINQN